MTCVAECLLEGVAACNDEGDFLGVNRVHLTVIYEYADVACVRTGERAFYHSFLDTLEDCRHEAEVDGTADYAVVELKLAAPFEFGDILGLDVELGVLAVNLELGVEISFSRTYEEVNLTELACTA